MGSATPDPAVRRECARGRRPFTPLSALHRHRRCVAASCRVGGHHDAQRCHRFGGERRARRGRRPALLPEHRRAARDTRACVHARGARAHRECRHRRAAGRGACLCSPGCRRGGRRERASVVAKRLGEVVRGAGGAMVGPNCMGRPRRACCLDRRRAARRPLPGTWPCSVSPGRSRMRSSARRPHRAALRRLLRWRGGHRCGRLRELLRQDEGTRAVGLFLETVRRPAAFADASRGARPPASRSSASKVGRSEAAARAALSHTGALVGSVRAFSALLRRYGAIEVEDFHELLETLEILGRRRWPRARLGAISESRRVRAAGRPRRGRRHPVPAPLRGARAGAAGGVPQLPRPGQPARRLGGRPRGGGLPAFAGAAGGVRGVRRPARARRPVPVP